MKRGTVIGVVAASAAAAVAVGALVWTLTRPGDADDAALAYLDALQTGDVAALQSLLPDDADAAAALDAFADADARVEGAEIISRTTHDDVASYTADVRLGDTSGTLGFALRADDGAWRLDSGALITVDVAVSLGTAVAVGDVVLPLSPDGEVRLLPGGYTLHAAPARFLDGQAQVSVLADDAPAATIDATLSPDAATLAQPQLDAYARTCEGSRAALPEDCGLHVPWAADLATLTEVVVKVQSSPQLSLDADALSFLATGGQVVATATGTLPGGGVASFTYRDDDWTLRGAVRFDGDEMLLQLF
ncbi:MULTISPECIES: hypothetical protein [Microbacterium]|uniref:hypothetical protein n=1 Tax=Microbacterium TaxID=33882 RepID=UPI00214BE2B6|nr:MULTISPECIES: hypothetical protein [unclassified Microbacterium]MCR2812170.1 hypothetical protein [Microbacterium sp. zg.Y1084]MDL5486205.1 hypothetical protein [Microbacterium sp. zg-Y1211]